MPRNAYLDPPSDFRILDRIRSSAIRVLNRFCLPGFVNVNVQRAVYWVGLENENLNARTCEVYYSRMAGSRAVST